MSKSIQNRVTGLPNAGAATGVSHITEGELMKHLSDEEAVNFVNRVMSAEKQVQTQKHIESGCKRCAETVAIWQNVRKASSVEAEFQPPAGVVRIAKAAFAATGLEKASGGAKLLFDSILQPAAFGVRSVSNDTRQLLYGVGPYLLDLYISAKPGGKAISVTGQLMNSKFPEKILNAVPIIVGNGAGTVVLATTNSFGEFQGELECNGDLELRLPNPNGQEIVIRLGCLLNGLTGVGADCAKQTPESPRY
jgi:hypothetical protein